MIETNIAPITSENCHLLTPLDLFYWSLEQIVIQGQRSLDGDLRCSYRTSDDLTGNILKCAAGHCIPDDAYDPVMENIVLDTPGEPPLVPSVAGAALGHSRLNAYFNGRFSVDQLKAIKCAQLVHDNTGLITVTDVVTIRNITMERITAFTAPNAGHLFRIALEDFLKD